MVVVVMMRIERLLGALEKEEEMWKESWNSDRRKEGGDDFIFPFYSTHYISFP